MLHDQDELKTSPRVFISHSRHDRNLQFFLDAFHGTGVSPIIYEFDPTNPFDVGFGQIRDGIADPGTRATFVLLCPEMVPESVRHTRNWIDFEVGLSCGTGLPVWIFEPTTLVPFNVPYCKVRKFYDPSSNADKEYVRRQLSVMAHLSRPMAYSLTPTTTEAFDNGTPGRFITCHECHLPFRQVDPVGLFPCPSCRVLIDQSGAAPNPHKRA